MEPVEIAEQHGHVFTWQGLERWHGCGWISLAWIFKLSPDIALFHAGSNSGQLGTDCAPLLPFDDVAHGAFLIKYLLTG